MRGYELVLTGSREGTIKGCYEHSKGLLGFLLYEGVTLVEKQHKGLWQQNSLD